MWVKFLHMSWQKSRNSFFLPCRCPIVSVPFAQKNFQSMLNCFSHFVENLLTMYMYGPMSGSLSFSLVCLSIFTPTPHFKKNKLFSFYLDTFVQKVCKDIMESFCIFLTQLHCLGKVLKLRKLYWHITFQETPDFIWISLVFHFCFRSQSRVLHCT